MMKASRDVYVYMHVGLLSTYIPTPTTKASKQFHFYKYGWLSGDFHKEEYGVRFSQSDAAITIYFVVYFRV